MIAYFQGRRKAARYYRDEKRRRNGAAVLDLDPVDSLCILPLIDYYAARDDLETEPGVSYLVRAGDTTILFDLGFNGRAYETPPLLGNMERLGVAPAEIDQVVISHPHSDHLGGKQNKLARQAILREDDDPLAGKPHISTVPLRVTHGTSRVVTKPELLAKGVATTGPLPVQLLSGYTLEQSLVIKVKNAGIVIVIGCGHPGLQRIVESAERVFGGPVFGVIGGLHYPVTQDRRATGWFKPQKVYGNPNPPWRPISRRSVRGAVRFLKDRDVRLVSVSPHDSCDWSLATFAQAFGKGYQPLKVGHEICVKTRGIAGPDKNS